MMTRCAICGAPLTGNVCSYCGTPVQTGRKAAGTNARTHTNGSGAENGRETRSERKTRRTEAEAASCRTVASPRSKWVALILCLTLGWLGIHRFYVGKIGTGVLFWITRGFHGIGIVVDLVLILSDRFEDAEGRRLIGESETREAEAC